MTIFPDEAASTYDKRIETLVPAYKLALSLMASVFKTGLKDNSHILVAGCGTGSDLLELAKSLPDAWFTAVEASRGMLEKAKERVEQAGFSRRVIFKNEKIEDCSGVYDGATLSLVLHFIPFAEKLVFLQHLAERLKKGGLLLLFDVSETKDDKVLENWLQMRIDDKREVAATMNHLENDWYHLSQEKTRLLFNQAGFNEGGVIFHACCYQLSLWARK